MFKIKKQPYTIGKQNQNKQTENGNKKNGWHDVEKLLKSKYMNNKRYYLVKWANGSNPTWEPLNNVSQYLNNCIIRQSEKENENVIKWVH